jgi:hypothetical protein
MLALVSICFILLGFFLGFECLINALVGINDKSDDNVDKNEICQLHEGHKVQNDSRVMLFIVDQLIHVDYAFPVILPH